MGRKRMAALLGSITYCVALVAGCSSNSGVVTQTPDTSTSTSVESSPTSVSGSTEQSVSLSSSASANSAPSSSAVGNPWPANFTPDQVAAAQAALAAFGGYIAVNAEANANPAAKDWTGDIRKYTADPVASQTL